MKARILIVDDEVLILLALEHALKSAGYEVATAMNGNKAIEMIHEHKPDIVITDQIMPGMNGIQLCRRIKEISPETEVVLLSGYPEDSKTERDFIHAGGTDVFLRKPLHEDEIRKAVETIMREKT